MKIGGPAAAKMLLRMGAQRCTTSAVLASSEVRAT